MEIQEPKKTDILNDVTDEEAACLYVSMQKEKSTNFLQSRHNRFKRNGSRYMFIWVLLTAIFTHVLHFSLTGGRNQKKARKINLDMILSATSLTRLSKENTDDYLERVTHLHLQGKRIRKIDGLESCTNLKVCLTLPHDPPFPRSSISILSRYHNTPTSAYPKYLQ